MNNAIHTSISTHDIKQVNKVGGIERTAKRVRVASVKDSVEASFMGLAFKSNRAQAQRSDRAGKRVR